MGSNIFNKFYLIVIFFLSAYVNVLAQNSFNASEISTKQYKIKELFERGMHAAVLTELQSLYIHSHHIEQPGFVSLEELEFYGISSGIILNFPSFVSKGIDQLNNFKDMSLRSKLAFHIGNYYFKKELYKESIAMLSLVDSTYLSVTDFDLVQFEKGLGLFSMNEFKLAKNYFDKFILERSNVYYKRALYYKGCIAFSEKDYVEALNNFIKLDQDPSFDKVIPFYLAYLFYIKGDDEKSIKYGEDYLRSDNGLHYSDMLLLMSSVYFNRNNFDRSVILYEKAIKAGTVLTPDQRYELGSGYYHLEKHAKAIEQLKPLSAGKDTIAFNSMYILGHSYLHIGDKKNARSAFQYCIGTILSKEKLQIAEFLISKLSLELGFEDQGLEGMLAFIKKYPDSEYLSEAKEIVLTFYARTNNFTQAISIIDGLDKTSKAYNLFAPRIYYGRAVEFLNDLAYDSSLLLFDQLTSFKKSAYYAPSVFWQGEIAFRKQEYKTTVALMDEYLSLPANMLGEVRTDNALYNLGYAYLELEEYEKALNSFEKLIALNKKFDTEFSRESILRAADCAMMTKDFTKAKNLYGKIRETTGYGADYALYQLAAIAGARSIDDKIQLLKEFELKFPTSEFITMATMELADAYMSEEEFNDAIPSLNKIIKTVGREDEYYPIALLKLGIAQYNLGNDNDALKLNREIIEAYPGTPQAAEALDNVRAIFVDKGEIDEYQQFLSSFGKSIDDLQKDSLFFQFVQTTYAGGDTNAALTSITEYLKKFPSGMYVSDVLNYQAELYVNIKDWKSAANAYSLLAEKGASKYQEKALRQSAKIYFSDLRDYPSAYKQFTSLLNVTSKPDVILEALRGDIRCCYYLKTWDQGALVSETLINHANASQDDKVIASLFLGYAKQKEKEYATSQKYFEMALSGGNNNYASEAGYQIAFNHFSNNNLDLAEKIALQAISATGSSEMWRTKSYILLSDIAFAQSDYFNAKATLKSIIENSKLPELKEEASTKLKLVELTEKGKGKK